MAFRARPPAGRAGRRRPLYWLAGRTVHQVNRKDRVTVAILICFAAAGIGSLATTPQIPGWYANLAKPTWTPPGWIFGPVRWFRLLGVDVVGRTERIGGRSETKRDRNA